MKKIKAFLAALLIFVITVTSFQLHADAAIDRQPKSFGTWLSPVKYANAAIMKKNMNKHSILVMGSSELEHGRDTPYHPEQIFANSKYQLMLSGAGYYQSLFHATALAGMGGGMKNRKVVLIVSPQWFRKPGVLKAAYASRFSEMNYLNMLKNPRISKRVKAYISERTIKLLADDPQTQARVRKYRRRYLAHRATAGDKQAEAAYGKFLQAKTNVSITTKRALADAASALKPGQVQACSGEPSPKYFRYLRKMAARDGAAASASNPFHIADPYYRMAISAKLKACRHRGVTTGYSQSPEYDDLRCFLEVCRESGIKPLLVEVPVNASWYDYIGFNKAKREEYYTKIRTIAGRYDTRLADFSAREYDPAFMYDTIHIGWDGWVDVSEAIYKYAKE